MGKNITKAKHRFPLRQIRHIPRFFRVHWPVIAITAFVLSLAYLNYEPGTILIGWDNLSSELAPLVNLNRALFSVWEEYQSLGLLGGMAHAADLPRALLVYFISSIPNIPISSIRYLLTFLPLILGPLGTYFFLYQRVFKNHLDSRTSQYASFLGGLFYLLNLATMQTFFTPFESFTYFYGSFPWLLFFITGYLENPKLDSLIKIFIVSFIVAPSFYIETLFVVFCLSLTPVFTETYFQHKNKITSLKLIMDSFLSLVLPNLFWLLPIIFFVLTNGHVGEEAKINLISSPETFYRNLEFGNLFDIALLRGYFFNFLDLTGPSKFDYLLSVWRFHLATPIISIIGYLIFALMITGLYYSVTKKFKWTKSLIGILMLCLFFLLGGGMLINSAIPLVGELFRSPFTKFSTPLSFTFACFFSIGCVFILDIFTYLHNRLTYFITLFSIILLLVIYTSPAFSGNLLSTNMRLTLPQEYIELFDYLRNQDPATRIANFPQYTFWGWNYYDWGYRGSGFLWYGIKQPILDRAFDVWEKTSENYYEEISSALFSKNLDEFEKVLDKYAVSWVLLDKHVIAPDTDADIGNKILEKFLANSSKFSLDKNFNDQIFLYRVNLDSKPKDFLSITPEFNTQLPFEAMSLRPDTRWLEKGGYLSTNASITSGNELVIPSLTSTEKLIPVRVDYQKLPGRINIRLSPITPIIFVDDKQIDLEPKITTVTIPVSSSTDSYVLQVNDNFWLLQSLAELPNLYDYMPLTTSYLPVNSNFRINLFSSQATEVIDLKNTLSMVSPAQCYTSKPDRKIEKIVTSDDISLLGTDVVGCLSVPLPYIPIGSLISLTFVYSSPTLIPANANFSDQNFVALETPQPLEPSSTPKPAQIFSISNGNYQQVNLILEASNTKAVQEIRYHDINLTTHQPIFSTTTKVESIPKLSVDLTGSEKSLQVSLPVTDSALDITQTPESNGFFPESRNCDQFNDGKAIKIVSPDGFLYQSQNAIECDYLNLRHLPHSLNYLLSFNVNNLKGLPLTVCLENQTTFRCDIYERLEKSYISQTLLQPIANSEEPVGYSLHLFNQSVGNRITTNHLRSFSIRPIPLTFIKNISVKSITSSETTAQITDSTHPAEFLYTLSIKEPVPGNILNLYQTRSPYWKAFVVPVDDLKKPPWLLTAKLFISWPSLPSLTPYGESWHNSWQLREGENNLIIIYLPQYLQFIGFAAILLTTLILLILSLIPNPKKK